MFNQTTIVEIYTNLNERSNILC